MTDREIIEMLVECNGKCTSTKLLHELLCPNCPMMAGERECSGYPDDVYRTACELLTEYKIQDFLSECND
jgi:hypothetical protein